MTVKSARGAPTYAFTVAVTGGRQTFTPKPGSIFLVVEAMFRNVNPIAQSKLPRGGEDRQEVVSATDITVSTKDGQKFTAIVGAPEGQACILCVIVPSPGTTIILFPIPQELVNEEFQFRFRDGPPIAFSVQP